MPGPYPREFREDVIAVACHRESGVTIKQIATDFGISEATHAELAPSGRL